MRREFHSIIWLILLFSCGCSTTNDVVGHGPFQKRKYRPGWHVNLGHRKQLATEHMAREQDIIGPIAALPVSVHKPIAPASPLMASVVAPERTEHTSAARWDPPTVQVRTDHVVPIADPPLAPAEEETSDGPRRWNRMALVSGAFLLLSGLVIIAGGGPVLGYLMAFAIVTGIIGLLLAIKHKERGKGIAIAAIAFPIAVLALVIAALNATW